MSEMPWKKKILIRLEWDLKCVGGGSGGWGRGGCVFKSGRNLEFC